MSDTCKTVKVIGPDGGYVIINESDFDEEKHTMYDPLAELVAEAKALGIARAGAMSEQTLRARIAEAKDAAAGNGDDDGDNDATVGEGEDADD